MKGQEKGKSYGLVALMKRTTPMVEKGAEDSVFSWPHLLLVEVLLFLGVSLALLLMGMFINAPLREMANPDVTENPAKAPWYFLNLQELLLHMNPALAGVIIPTTVIIFLMAIPYIDHHKEDIGIWFSSAKGKRVILFTSIYTSLALVGLIFFDEYIRVKSLIAEPEIIPGWLIPIVVMAGLTLLLTALLRWRYQPNTRELLIAYFTAFMVSFLVLTFFGLFLRGLGMRLIPPWELPPRGLSF